MNPPEPVPAPSATARRRKTMDEIRRVGLMSSMSLPMETELLHEIVEAAQPPAGEMSDSGTLTREVPACETSAKETPRAPLRVARSPHPLDNFSFDQLCPEDDDGSADVQEETSAKQDLPKGPFKGPINKVAAPSGVRKSERYVPKTMLDHNLILQNLAVSVAKSQEKLAQKVAEKEAEPPKPCIPIEKYKMAQATCPFTWGEMDAPKEKFRYCDKCQAPVYNFTGMDLPEAEELIFKREERRKAPLFKRADGKFMTKDCPVALKKKYGMIMMIAGGILVLTILAGWAVLMPPQPKPVETPSGDVVPQVETMPSQPQPNGTQPGSDSGQGSVNQVVPPITPPTQELPPEVPDPNASPNQNETQSTDPPGA